MTDFIVLAEDTPEIAMGQKNSTRTMTSNQGRLLPIMGKNTGNPQVVSCMTIPCLTVQTIGPALTGTQGTGSENLVQDFNPVV